MRDVASLNKTICTGEVGLKHPAESLTLDNVASWHLSWEARTLFTSRPKEGCSLTVHELTISLVTLKASFIDRVQLLVITGAQLILVEYLGITTGGYPTQAKEQEGEVHVGKEHAEE